MTELQESATPVETKDTETPNKIGSIMEAASALSSLGEDEENTAGQTTSQSTGGEAEQSANNGDNKDGAADGSSKRFLPEHKKPDAAPTFPEKMMKLMRFADEQEDKDNYCVAWCDDGKSFVIRNPDAFAREVVPKFFKPTKFTSFTRKLYRWGFRQINRGIGPDDPIIFGNEHFQRGHPEMIANMRSVTAASTRKAEQQRINSMAGFKRGFDDYAGYGEEETQKRMVFNRLLQQQTHMMAQQPTYYANGPMPLSSALRPHLGVHGTAGGPGGMVSPNMMMNMSNAANGGMVIPAHYSQMAPQQPPMQQQQQQQFPPSGAAAPPQYPNSQTTSEIVNAAIAALRHAA